MKIYIDISVLTLATFVTGIQRVTREIAVRLVEQQKDNVVLLHYNAKENKYRQIDNHLFCRYYLEGIGAKNKMITKRRVELSEICQDTVFFDLDAAWMSRIKRSYLLPILKRQGARIVVHVYDIISITHPQYCLQRGVYNFMDYIGAHLQFADDIITNAKATVHELETLGKRIGVTVPPCHVVPLGADFGEKTIVKDSQVTEILCETANERPFILMVGTIEPRKNHKLLLDAYDIGLKDMGYNIIMAGYMGWNMDEFQTRLNNHSDYGSRIFHFEGLDDTAITYLYQKAKFLAFCSYTEGYGLPIIEAIRRGTPVIASDIPVSREVAGEYCVWFEQDNTMQFCDLIKKMHNNTEEYDRIKNNNKEIHCNSWEISSREIASIINKE